MGQKEKAHPGTQTFLTGRVRLDLLAQFSWGFMAAMTSVSENSANQPSAVHKTDQQSSLSQRPFFSSISQSPSACMLLKWYLLKQEPSPLAGWRGRHDHKPSCTAGYPTASHRHWDADCRAWNPLSSHQFSNLPPTLQTQVTLNNFYLRKTSFLLNSRLGVRLDLCVCVWESLYLFIIFLNPSSSWHFPDEFHLHSQPSQQDSNWLHRVTTVPFY